MKYYLIAGETSGDLHAANLIKAIKLIDHEAQFRGWGGDRMAAQGVDIVKHIRELAFMGFAEVIANLGTILSNLSFCKKDILQYKPEAVILVDYPGFNLRIAEFLHTQGIKVIYYISPQVWAWKKSRVHKIRKVVDKLLVILPFEKDFYSNYGVDAEFIGHPLLDELNESHLIKDLNTAGTDLPYKNDLSQPQTSVGSKEQKAAPEAGRSSLKSEKTVSAISNQSTPVSDNVKPEQIKIALLPGSRKQEISKVLPEMLRVIPNFPGVKFTIAGVSTIGESFYREITGTLPIDIVMNDTYKLLTSSTAALVTSGTATLETALIGIPEVVCYKGGWLSYTIARQLVKVKYISLVNLIMDRVVVKELIQNDLNRENLAEELNNLINNHDYREKMLDNYRELRNKLGGSGASARAAESIYNFLNLRINLITT